MKELEINCAVDVVLDTGGVKGSFVLDVTNKTIVLLQTFPPLDRSFLNKPVLITYVTRDKKMGRYGFLAEIAELREGYETKGRGVPAIITKRLSDSENCELRSYPRIKPTPHFEVLLNKEYVEVVDISAGGIHIVQRPGEMSSTEINDIVCIEIEVGDTSIRTDAKVLRKWKTKGLNGPEHLALKFLEEIPFHILSNSH